MDVEHFRYIFDRLYSLAKQAMEKYNPCNVQNGECYRAYSGQGQNFCCEGCRHLSRGKGCTVESVMCTLWLCEPAAKKLPDKARLLFMSLNDMAAMVYMRHFRSSKDYSINSAVRIYGLGGDRDKKAFHEMFNALGETDSVILSACERGDFWPFTLPKPWYMGK